MKYHRLLSGARSIWITNYFTVRINYKKVLCYKSEGRWFDPSWCNLIFSLT